MNDQLDYLAASARTDLESLLDPAPPDLAIRSQRRRHNRRVVGLVAVVAIVLAASPLARRDSGGSEVSVVADATGTPAPVAPVGVKWFDALPTDGQLLAAWLDDAANPHRGHAFMARKIGDKAEVETYEFDGSWHQVSVADGDSEEEDDPTSEREVPHLIGEDLSEDTDISLEFRTTPETGKHVFGLISGAPTNEGGARVISFSIVVYSESGEVFDRIVTSERVCQPTCSAGRQRRELLRYSHSSSTESFEVIDSTMCTRNPLGIWECDDPDSLLATGKTSS